MASVGPGEDGVDGWGSVELRAAPEVFGCRRCAHIRASLDTAKGSKGARGHGEHKGQHRVLGCLLTSPETMVRWRRASVADEVERRGGVVQAEVVSEVRRGPWEVKVATAWLGVDGHA